MRPVSLRSYAVPTATLTAVVLAAVMLVALVLLAACAPATDEAFPTAMPDLDALASEIDSLLAAAPDATVAVTVIDGATTFHHGDPDRAFHAASTMKVPVLIELVRQAEAGRFALDDSLVLVNDFRSILDGSPYQISADADTALYARLGEPVPLRTLAERMVTHSSNLATNLLIAHVGADSVQATIERLGTTTMRVLRGVEDIPAYRAGLSNTATAHDLAQLMSALMDGRAVGPEADAAMVEILLDQRHNEMIPARLPSDTRVAHKTGWITRIHHDAAIVYPELDASSQAPYVLVILTEGIDDYDASAVLGASIAGAVHAAFRPTTPS
ncbi:MAG: serine hydrolase [Bacteroidota bacterium]